MGQIEVQKAASRMGTKAEKGDSYGKVTSLCGKMIADSNLW
jgi:hypothetical protein